MKEVFREFVPLLKRRLGRIYTTEDSVRYTFFAALLKQNNFAPHEIILEYPHPKIKGAEIDTYIPSTSIRKGLVLECKYDRRIPSGKNSPKPQKAGKLFNDIYRLTQFNKDPNAFLWLIYLTDIEMAMYFRNQRNGLVDFFELPDGNKIRIDNKYISSKCKTFQTVIGGAITADIKCILSESMPDQHELRIYEILATTSVNQP